MTQKHIKILKTRISSSIITSPVEGLELTFFFPVPWALDVHDNWHKEKEQDPNTYLLL